MDYVSVPRHQRVSRFSRFLFGACYYPEHWERSWIEADAALMAEASVNVVRMAEFAWTLMEPKRDAFDFSLFAEAVEILERHGIDSILCTPTATPPRWLTVDHPEWMRVNVDGVPFTHGTRQHVCTNNLEFRAESRRITRAMAEAFKDSSSVIGWQTDNEFYCHVSECYCPSCQTMFREWVSKKYGNEIEALNHAWGTAFWSQQYDGFEQVEIPREGRQPAPCNPTALLDFHRFLSDSLQEFQREQVEILREVNADWWVTHNGIFKRIDYWKLTGDLDFLGVDVYPAFWGTEPQDFVGASDLNERCRQASGSYIVPEQCGGPGGQYDFLQPTPELGRMRLWAYQSIAHGADGMIHFRWRTCRYGAEIHWHGILDHDNVPRRRYEEFAQEGRELKKVGERILGTAERVDFGICYDHDQDSAQAVMQMDRVKPDSMRCEVLEHLMRRKFAAGYVNEADSFAGLKVLFLPSAIMMDADLAAKLERFVAEGGILLATATTAQRDRNNHAIGETPPGLLQSVFGIRVEEFGKVAPHRSMTLDGDRLSFASDYYEILSCEGAQPLAQWHFAENVEVEPAHQQVGMTVNQYGKGKAFYFGSFLSGASTQAVVDLICEEAGLKPMAAQPKMCSLWSAAMRTGG